MRIPLLTAALLPLTFASPVAGQDSNAPRAFIDSL